MPSPDTPAPFAQFLDLLGRSEVDWEDPANTRLAFLAVEHLAASAVFDLIAARIAPNPASGPPADRPSPKKDRLEDPAKGTASGLGVFLQDKDRASGKARLVGALARWTRQRPTFLVSLADADVLVAFASFLGQEARRKDTQVGRRNPKEVLVRANKQGNGGQQAGNIGPAPAGQDPLQGGQGPLPENDDDHAYADLFDIPTIRNALAGGQSTDGLPVLIDDQLRLAILHWKYKLNLRQAAWILNKSSGGLRQTKREICIKVKEACAALHLNARSIREKGAVRSYAETGLRIAFGTLTPEQPQSDEGGGWRWRLSIFVKDEELLQRLKRIFDLSRSDLTDEASRLRDEDEQGLRLVRARIAIWDVLHHDDHRELIRQVLAGRRPADIATQNGAPSRTKLQEIVETLNDVAAKLAVSLDPPRAIEETLREAVETIAVPTGD
jgi:hypothetical protein